MPSIAGTKRGMKWMNESRTRDPCLPDCKSDARALTRPVPSRSGQNPVFATALKGIPRTVPHPKRVQLGEMTRSARISVFPVLGVIRVLDALIARVAATAG